MKKYNISVNGVKYEVEVEEEGAVDIPAPATAAAPPVAGSAAPPPVGEAKPAAPDTAAPSAGSTVIEAPMPGTVLDVRVEIGQTVKMGEVLLILEAMKMENEIVAPQNGAVDAIVAGKGDSVNAGDILLSLK